MLWDTKNAEGHGALKPQHKPFLKGFARFSVISSSTPPPKPPHRTRSLLPSPGHLQDSSRTPPLNAPETLPSSPNKHDPPPLHSLQIPVY